MVRTKYILGNVLRNMGESRLAIGLLNESFIFYERTHRARSAMAGRTLADLSSAHLDAGYSYSARRLANRAMTILEGSLASNDPAWGAVWNLQGRVAQNFREFDEAIRLHERTLAIAPSSDAEWLNRVPAFVGLGRALSGQAHHQAARECQESALRVLRHAFGAQSPVVVRPLLSLANALMAVGEFGMAKQRAGEALAIIDGPVPLGSSLTTYGLRSLGSLYVALNDRTTARQLFARALSIREREAGT